LIESDFELPHAVKETRVKNAAITTNNILLNTLFSPYNEFDDIQFI